MKFTMEKSFMLSVEIIVKSDPQKIVILKIDKYEQGEKNLSSFFF